MENEGLILSGNHVRLEPLNRSHLDGLLSAAAGNSSFYQWTFVPQTVSQAAQYIDTAVRWRDAGSAVPFAIVLLRNGAVVGSTRFWNLERWSWPEDHSEYGRHIFDACEIGHTWLASAAIRTAANTEAKLLMLTHAFETWRVLRVCLHTDARNQRSRAAIERIGGKFEGVLRAHRLAADYIPRDSARFSIVAAEWPVVKRQVRSLLDRA